MTLASTAQNLGAGPCPDPNQDNVGENILQSKVFEEKKQQQQKTKAKQTPNPNTNKQITFFLWKDDVSESSMDLGYSWDMHSDAAIQKRFQVLQFDHSL